MVKRKGRKSQSEIEEVESLKKEILRARSKGQWKEIADLLNRLGTVYRELKQFDDALDKHDEEADITKKYFPADKIGLAIAYRAKAEVYLEMKEEELALPLVREYLRVSKSIADLVEEQRAHVTLGRVYLGLALKYSESDDPTAADSRAKALNRAEDEFQKARDLANSTEMEDKRLGPGLMDMRCGVLVNIALVFDLKGNVDGSKQFILRAIEIAKDHKFYEHLYRGYIFLSEIYTKFEKYIDAKIAAEEAVKAAKSLENFSMEVDARVLEAKMYFLLDEITSGVRVLKKLRKQIMAKRNDAVLDCLEDIETLLKAGVRITRKEDGLHMTDKMDYRKRQKLYEGLADGYVDVGNYTEALIHYRNSIENAEKAKLSGKELAKLYFSVAATYRDKGDEANALQYFLKEIELHAHNPTEAFKTQTNITSSLEKLPDVSQEEIIGAHEKALDLARICDSPKKQIAALNNFASYLKTIRRNILASEMQNKADELKELYNLSGDIEGDSQEDLLDGDAEDDDADAIDLDNLTTDDDSSDEDENEAKNKSAPKKRKFRVNEKGETALHTAAIKGDVKIVRRLLRQGQDVNAKDMGGWVPLHEACNFGHLEIVEELLKNGARVNEPCGKVCGELTPLHDAANNGHSAVIHLLLKYKANVLARDTKGNYPIDLLIAWRERAKADGTIFSPEDLTSYREIRTILRDLMEKAGRPYERSDEIRARKNGQRDREGGDDSFELMESRFRGSAPIPVRITTENYDPDDADAAVDLYSTTIRGIRNRGRKSTRRGGQSQDDGNGSSDEEDKHKRTAASPEQDGLIPASQYVDDDWLVDGGDLQETSTKPTTKRKRVSDPMDEIRMMDARSIRRRREGKRNDVARCDIVHDGNGDENSEELLDLDDDLDLDLREPPSFGVRSNRSPSLDPDLEDEPSISRVSRAIDENSSDTDFDFGNGKLRRNRSRTFSELMAEDDLGDEGQDSDEIIRPSETTKRTSTTNPIILSSDEEDNSEEFGLSHYHRLSNDDSAFTTSASSKAASKPGTTLSRNRSRILQQRLPFKTVQTSPDDVIASTSGKNGKTTKSPPNREQILNRTENILRLKIRVNEKVFMVPVVERHLNDTIEWLCEECSRRYFDSYGVKPILTLRTKDGAILSGNDVIRVVLCGNDTELIATVMSFDLQRLPERFKTAAAKIHNFKYDEDILLGLDVCQSSNVLSIPDCNLRSKIGHTLFQALQYQNALRELHLPDCSLHDEGIQNLASIMPTLPNIVTLDLSCNGITSNGVHDLSEAFKKTAENFQNQRQCTVLTTLNLSFNPLGNSAGSPLTNLLSQLIQLRNLFLSSCDFTLRLFTESRLANALSKLKLEDVDISFNEWGKTGLDTILQSLTPGRIKSLNCTSSYPEDLESSFGTIFSSFLSRNEDCCNLKELNLSDCALNDEGVNEISCHIGRLVRLESLILKNNENLTLSSAVPILNECSSNKIPLTNLDFRSCPNLWKMIGNGNGHPMETFLNALEKKLGGERKLEFLGLTVDEENKSDFVENDGLSEREKKIARLYEEYSGTVTFSCVRNGNSVTFTYER